VDWFWFGSLTDLLPVHKRKWSLVILKVNIGSIEGASIDARGELVPDPTAEREVTDSKAARDLEKGEHCSIGLFVQRESAWAAAKIGISGRD
jgi:hypothetical protein